MKIYAIELQIMLAYNQIDSMTERNDCKLHTDYLLPSKTAQELYQLVKNAPIYDYHCHLSPREIWEDIPFDNIGEMWLSGDHYKWRLMRAAGIPEEKITGSASWHDKFLAYAGAVSLAAGNPLYHWTQMELSFYFGVETPLNPNTAEGIWEQANRVIREKKLSPRKLIEQSNVAFIATTDDAADSLEYHEKLKNDASFRTVITPSFRADNVWLLNRRDYADYIAVLSETAGISITDLKSLRKALSLRLDAFEQAGCRFTDVGIPFFPDGPGTEAAAERAFADALTGKAPAPEDYSAFLWQMYIFAGKEYRRRGMIMQLHLAVERNANTPLFLEKGGDCGGDCIGDVISGQKIVQLLDAIHTEGGLTQTILYTLNPAMTAQLCSIAGSFPNVRMGAAWWFNDHKRGISDVIQTIAEIHYVGSFLGMLTDSRSFLSYARHDYFRRILCGILAQWHDSGEFSGDIGILAKAICYGNIKKLIEEK